MNTDAWRHSYVTAIEEVAAEAHYARGKFLPFNSPHEGYATILEKLDKVRDEVRSNNLDAAIAEAVQVGAMAVRFIADMRAKQATKRQEEPK